MTKIKVGFSIGNFFRPSDVKVVKIQATIKAFTVLLTGSTYYQTNIQGACFVAAIGFILDGLATCLSFEEIPQ